MDIVLRSPSGAQVDRGRASQSPRRLRSSLDRALQIWRDKGTHSGTLRATPRRFLEGGQAPDALASSCLWLFTDRRAEDHPAKVRLFESHPDGVPVRRAEVLPDFRHSPVDQIRPRLSHASAQLRERDHGVSPSSTAGSLPSGPTLITSERLNQPRSMTVSAKVSGFAV